ncbi:MAG: OmpA family protein [bacterium]
MNTSIKRLALVALLAGLLVPTTAQAKWSEEHRERLDAPTLEGGAGLFRTLSATAGSTWDLRVGMHFEYFQHNEFIVANWEGCAPNCPNEQNRRFQGAITAGFTPYKYIEIFATLFSSSNINERNHLEPTQEPSVQMALGDWVLGLKGFYPVHKAVSLGGNFGVKFLNSYGNISTNAKATNIFFNLLLTFDVRKIAKQVPLRFHLNLGFIYDPSHKVLGDDPADYTPSAAESSETHHAFLVQQFALGLNHNRFRTAIGIDAPMPYVGGLINPIVEVQIDVATGNADERIVAWREFEDTTKNYNVDGRASARLALGIRWRPVGGLFIDTGIDVALSHQGFAMGPPLPPWNFFVQLGYVFSAKARTKIKTIIKTNTVEVPKIIRPPATEGKIRGVVKDSKTGVPVAAAIITFPGLGLTDLATAEDGSYTTYKLKAGKVKLEVRHPSYQPWSGVGIVLVEKTVTLNIPLIPAAPKTGTVIGTVTDATGTPLAATVEVEGTETKKVSADSTGAFNMILKPGAYKIKASMSGYFNKYNAFVVNAGTKQSLEFKLTKRPARPVVIIQKTRLTIRKKIHFAYNKAQIRPDSLQILEEVAAVLQENPEIARIRIEGHTDRRGGWKRNITLSQSRAEAVRDYLISQGVDPARLVARGYGSKRPLVPELTPRHRAINRRVEFRIEKRTGKYVPARRRRR